MRVIFYIFTVILFCTPYLVGQELNKLSIHSEIDNSPIIAINISNEFIDIYTDIAGFRLDRNFKLIEKFIKLDSTLANVVRINSVDYLNNKIYIGTHHYGLLVLNNDLKIVENYTADNSKLTYSKSCGTTYDSTNGNIMTLSCDFGLFLIDKEGNQHYSGSDPFFSPTRVVELEIIDNKYYIYYRTIDYENNEEVSYTVITDNEFNPLDTIDFDNKYDIDLYDRTQRIKETKNHISYFIAGGIIRNIITQNKATKETDSLDLETIGGGYLMAFKEIEENLALCTTEGLFEYNLETKSIKGIKINNPSASEKDSIIRDLDKLSEKSYLAATGNGVYILDETTNISNSDIQNKTKEYQINANLLTTSANNIKLEIINMNGQRINIINSFNSINLDSYIEGNGVFLLLFTIDNTLIGTEKYLKIH